MKHFRLSRVVDLLALPDARSDGSPRSPSPRSPSPCSASSFYSSSLYSSSIDSLSSRSASRSASRSPSRSSLSPSTLLNAFAPVSAEERRTLWALVESTLAPTTATLDVRAAGAGSQDDWIRRFGNVRLEDVGGDGDCQFRVLAALIYDDADKLGLVREQIATHMRRHPAQFATAHWNSQSRRVGDNAHSRFANLDEFCNAIGRDGGEWGNDATLLAAAEIYECAIQVLSSGVSGRMPLLGAVSATYPVPLVIGHYAEFHYVVVRAQE